MPKDRVSMHLIVHTGSMYETDDQQGLAHFLEHMLFNGSTHFKPGELVKYFQNIGMQFGPDANAHTGYKKTVYDLLLPDGSKKSLKDGLLVMQDYAEGALLLQSEIDRERRIVLAEKRTRDSAGYRTFVAVMKFKFPEARLSKRLPIGLDQVLETANQKEIKHFYDTWYRPKNMTLVLVGDFDIDTAVYLIEDKFSSFSPRGPPGTEPGIGEIHHKGIKPFYHFEKELGNTSVSIEVLQKTLKTTDSVAFQRDRLMEDMANRMVQNRLNAKVRSKNSPFTSASIHSGVYLQEIKYAEITAASSPENYERSLFLIEQTLRKALKHGFTKPELERVKKDMISELDDAVEKASTRDSGHLARQIIWSINARRVFMSPQQEKDLFSPLIESIPLEDIHNAFKNVWDTSHRLVLVTGNTNLMGMENAPEQQILSAYNKSKKIKVSKPVSPKPVVFPYLPEPEKEGRIVRRKNISDIGIIHIDFENGVRLNLKKTDFKDNEILVNLNFGFGKSVEPPDKPGLAALSEKVINESGLGMLSKEEIERATAGKNTRVEYHIGEDSFSIKGNTVPKELALLFQLLYAHLLDQGFREDAYRLSMERFKQQYNTLSRSINGAMVLHGRRFLAGGDHRFGLPPYSIFKQLTLDHVRSWVNASLTTDTIEVSVVGDFDVDSIIAIASKYLGSLSAASKTDIQQSSAFPHFPISQSTTLSVATNIPKGMVFIAFPTEDLWDIKTTRRLSVLSDIVSDRLRETIREHQGSAYSTFAFNRPSRAYTG
ncbi:MAG: insulinase family protein, partial [Desulfobacterales bacterium]